MGNLNFKTVENAATITQQSRLSSAQPFQEHWTNVAGCPSWCHK